MDSKSGSKEPENRQKLNSEKVSNSFRLQNFVSPAYKRALTDQIIEFIQLQEKAVCGFQLSGEYERQKVENLIENHAENIVKCTLLCASSMPVPFTDDEARRFYINLSRYAPLYYERLAGSLTNLIADVLKHQATHSQFA